MSRRIAPIAVALLLALLPVSSRAAVRDAVPTAFTYQGQLLSGGAPVTGTYDVTFRLWNAASAGTQIAGDVLFTGITVTQGLFSADVDFGPGAFDGTARWLEVTISGPGDPAPTTLAPRQAVTSSPYAIFSGQSATALAGGSGGASQWISNGPDLTYPSGSIGVTGASSPFASGKVVFMEGGNATFANVWAFNYDTFQPLNLLLNAPGGNVGINTFSPSHALEVVGEQQVTNTGTTLDGGGYSSAIWAVGNTGTGLFGRVSNGVTAFSTDGRAVYGLSTTNWGVTGECANSGTYGVLGSPGEGVYGSSNTLSRPGGHFVCPVGGVALRADGLAQVKTLQILGADLAESFPVEGEGAEPGTVLAIAGGGEGTLRVCDEPYCRRVAGVVSGAHGLAAGVVLKGAAFDESGHAAVAMSGRVWVKCDASAAPIHIGDLLTTSSRAGHAMRAVDPARATGAIVGKAMTTLESGTGLVLVLVSLQ
jgi:hypothetical protein